MGLQLPLARACERVATTRPFLSAMRSSEITECDKQTPPERALCFKHLEEVFTELLEKHVTFFETLVVDMIQKFNLK